MKDFDLNMAMEYGCMGCVFFHPYANVNDSGKGECRERSPESNSKTTPFHGHWPRVGANEWCGKFVMDHTSELRAKKYVGRAIRKVAQNRHEDVSETVETDPEC